MPEYKELGTIRKDYPHGYIAGETIRLAKHSWDCGWYWGFGYIGNKHLHTHFDSSFLCAPNNVDIIFSNTKIKGKTWWAVQDLFKQAYILKDYAELCRHGNGFISGDRICTVLKGAQALSLTAGDATLTNERLELVLDTIWELLP